MTTDQQTALNEDGLVPGQPVDQATWAMIEHKRYQEQLKALNPDELPESKPAARKRS